MKEYRRTKLQTYCDFMNESLAMYSEDFAKAIECLSNTEHLSVQEAKDMIIHVGISHSLLSAGSIMLGKNEDKAIKKLEEWIEILSLYIKEKSEE